MPTHAKRIWTLSPVLLVLALLLTGCVDDYMFKTAKGPWASQDRHEFESTVMLPVTVTLKNVYTTDTLWTKDVPVGHILVVDLDRKDEVELTKISGRPATKMTWYLYKATGGAPVAKGMEQLSGIPVLLKVDYRPAPEYPPGYEAPAPRPAATAPATKPAK